MAVFPDCEPALQAAFEAIIKARQITVGSYQPQLRGGIHVGHPERIGHDYVGVDVNIAARLCEAAPTGGVLISGAVHERLAGRWPAAHTPDIHLRGVPDEVSIHQAAQPQPNEPAQPVTH
jgi:adenylate cyclase